MRVVEHPKKKNLFRNERKYPTVIPTYLPTYLGGTSDSLYHLNQNSHIDFGTTNHIKLSNRRASGERHLNTLKNKRK